MPKSHSVIGAQRALIKRMGTQGRGVTLTATVVGSPTNIASIYVEGLTLSDLTPGNNYAVTTLAGTSPVRYGVAINSSESNFTQQLLNSLGQVGPWNNYISGMPPFEKVNSTYLTSTFNQPQEICLFGNKILVEDRTGTRILSNGYVHNFIVIG